MILTAKMLKRITKRHLHPEDDPTQYIGESITLQKSEGIPSKIQHRLEGQLHG